MKKFFFALTVLILFTATAHAEPVRIARLPIIFQSTIPDDKTCAALERQVERAIHIPLNGTLQFAEYLPPDESARVLNDLWSEMRTVDKKIKLAAAMRPLAEVLDADIIVCPVLLQYGEFVVGFASWLGEEILDSHAKVELIVYDRRTDELLDKKSSRMYHDGWSRLGTASHLATVCMDAVIAKTKLHELIMAIGK